MFEEALMAQWESIVVVYWWLRLVSTVQARTWHGVTRPEHGQWPEGAPITAWPSHLSANRRRALQTSWSAPPPAWPRGQPVSSQSEQRIRSCSANGRTGSIVEANWVVLASVGQARPRNQDTLDLLSQGLVSNLTGCLNSAFTGDRIFYLPSCRIFNRSWWVGPNI